MAEKTPDTDEHPNPKATRELPARENAALYASAPDLLEALEGVAGTDLEAANYRVLISLQRNARAAIAKARGEA